LGEKKRRKKRERRERKREVMVNLYDSLRHSNQAVLRHAVKNLLKKTKLMLLYSFYFTVKDFFNGYTSVISSVLTKQYINKQHFYPRMHVNGLKKLSVISSTTITMITTITTTTMITTTTIMIKTTTTIMITTITTTMLTTTMITTTITTTTTMITTTTTTITKLTQKME